MTPLLQYLRDLLHAPRLYRCGIEAQAHLPILQTLRQQILDTVRDVEQSVVSVCGSFDGMARRARQSVGQASHLLGDGDQADSVTVEHLIGTSQTTIEHLLERIERGSELSLEAVRSMQEMERVLQQVTKAVSEINEIAFRDKLLALNAKIEAVHVGELGAGFGVVADEITSQAERANALTEEIGESVQRLRSRVTAAAGRLRQSAEADRIQLDSARAEVRATLDALATAHAAMRDSLSAAADMSRGLARDITESVIAMQFQDRMSQRMGHVVETLQSMEEALREGHAAAPAALERQTIVAESMQSRFTMEREREVAQIAGNEPAGSAEGDVELF